MDIKFVGGIHSYWTGLTVFWIFAPFILHLFIIIFKRQDWKNALKQAFLHFPLAIPLRNCWAAYKLSKVDYSDPMPVSSITDIEEIKKVAGNLTQGEAFLVG